MAVPVLRTRLPFCVACVLLLARSAAGQNPPDSRELKPLPSCTLAPRKVEVIAGIGLYGVSFDEWVSKVGDVVYRPSMRPMFGASVGVGITSRIALHAGLDLADYRNDTYWRPEEPHNPYLATAHILSWWGGLRYEFRNPGVRLRPYVGGGVLAARFTNIERGPKDACFTSQPDCWVIAPELFYGTKVTGYGDFGLNVMLRPDWGLRTWIKFFYLRGDETDTTLTVDSPGDPTVHDLFGHAEFGVGIVYRWQNKTPARMVP